MGNCEHDNEHCHECQKSKNMDGLFALGTIIFVIGGFWLFGWSFFTEFWIFWVIVGIIAVCGLVVYWDRKRKKGKKK